MCPEVPSPPDQDDSHGRSDVKCEATVSASVSQPISSLFCVSLLSKNSLAAVGTFANLIMAVVKYAAVQSDSHKVASSPCFPQGAI